MTRIPSFNDFSPGIIDDVRAVLVAVEDHGPDKQKIYQTWADLNFKGVIGTRSTTNTQSTLTSIGLLNSSNMSLSPAGQEISKASSKQEAAALLSAHIIKHKHGDLLLKAVVGIRRRDEQVTKERLAKELKLYGVQLSTGTTDHTTLANWMDEGGLLIKSKNFEPNEKLIKQLTGISTGEAYEWDGLPLHQQVFVQTLRRLAEIHSGGAVPTKQVYDECLADHPALFDADQLQKKVVAPLEQSGWLTVERAQGRQGGKSGKVTPTGKLMGIPLGALLPGFDSAIPSDLLAKVNTSPAEVARLLTSKNKNEAGLGLELLALRMLIDLGLEPRGFRVRSADTGGAEIDLVAEGRHLMFSRWTVQCKNVAGSGQLADVAKEVGIAMFQRSHVIVMLSTNKFTRQAKDFARHITLTTHLQFVFIERPEVQAYLKSGPQALHNHFRKNAGMVMQLKRGQPVDPPEVEG